MPEISALGWFHTAMGIVALVSGGFALFQYKEITLQTRSSQIYLLATLVTAGTALAIFQQGAFGPGHVLALATLAALALGTVAATTQLFGKLSRYVRAVGYSATLLFHCVPAVTDGLMRLPVDDPVVKAIDDPLLKYCYVVLLILFIAGISAQLRWIRNEKN
ncbi:MAG: hypothetical protein ACR2Q3_13185 [Woeseiaceae bacterium]